MIKTSRNLEPIEGVGDPRTFFWRLSGWAKIDTTYLYLCYAPFLAISVFILHQTPQNYNKSGSLRFDANIQDYKNLLFVYATGENQHSESRQVIDKMIRKISTSFDWKD